MDVLVPITQISVSTQCDDVEVVIANIQEMCSSGFGKKRGEDSTWLRITFTDGTKDVEIRLRNGTLFLTYYDEDGVVQHVPLTYLE